MMGMDQCWVHVGERMRFLMVEVKYFEEELVSMALWTEELEAENVKLSCGLEGMRERYATLGVASFCWAQHGKNRLLWLPNSILHLESALGGHATSNCHVVFLFKFSLGEIEAYSLIIMSSRDLSSWGITIFSIMVKAEKRYLASNIHHGVIQMWLIE